jgi:hypothetical protein
VAFREMRCVLLPYLNCLGSLNDCLLASSRSSHESVLSGPGACG